MATSELKLKFGYEDETTRDIKIGPFATDAAAISGAKANIMAFNANDVGSVAGLLLSDGGASCTGIVAASIVTVNKTEINLNDVGVGE